MKGISVSIIKWAKDTPFFQMGQSTSEILRMRDLMDMDCSPLGSSTLSETSKTEQWKAMGYGKMAKDRNMLVSGKQIVPMDKVSILLKKAIIKVTIK